MYCYSYESVALILINLDTKRYERLLNEYELNNSKNLCYDGAKTST